MIQIALSVVERCTTIALRSLLGVVIAALGGYILVRGAHADAIALTNALLGTPLVAFGAFLISPGATGAGVDFLIDKLRAYRRGGGDAALPGWPAAAADATAHTSDEPSDAHDAHEAPHGAASVDVATSPTRPV